jgi:Zn-dependent protease with chaperone function
MRDEFSALIFGPDLPPGGAQGALSVSALGVEISVGERSRRASLADITLREVGFGKPGIEIAWRDGGDAWAAHVLDPIAAQRLLQTSPLADTAQAGKLKGAKRKITTGRSIGTALLAAFVLLPVILLLALVLNASSIAGWITDKIPIDQEIAMGKQAFAGMRGNLKLKDEGPAYDAVKNIIAKLTAGSKYTYEVHVAEDETLNAFAMPGGVIVVHTGLIAATKRPEELAGVLAHEVQHVELRHSMRGMIKEMGLRGLWAFVTGDLGGTLAGQAALELTSLKFSRDDETEADHRGLEALLAAGIDPAGMPAFFKIMSEKAGDAPAAFMSTHPLSEDRERELRARLTTLSGSPFTPLEFGDWPPPK